MIINFFILLLYLSKCRAGNTDVVAQNHLKIVQAGDTVNLTCISPKESRNSIVWVKQILGQKPISIVSSYQALPVEFDKGFDKHNRFFSAKDDTFFNLTITNTKESDTATYYCITFLYNFKFGHVTDLIVKGRGLNTPSEHERAVTDPDDPEDSVSLQCTVLTESCAGEHNVYWFRRKSGQSPPGVIFTQEHRNAGCERTSDINSAEHKCIYSLPKTNLGLSDAGIYYCAVAACGQIVFGDARKPDIPGTLEYNCPDFRNFKLFISNCDHISGHTAVHPATKRWDTEYSDWTFSGGRQRCFELCCFELSANVQHF
ncbi:novel immune-type receptor 2b isoform X2 [Puntigrus tetrazona]|uniref:novel immune-type receptor 2b isoform X2 n=1 Tax=Puntigrus tetrazona TaxID=1606681 RepID=UPI001C89A14C|nr:novel immune-type receptor 2b isoform X2 [Puntigrus tetrazona]